MSYNNYITTTYDNPYEYYWKQIDKSLAAMTNRDETKNKYRNHFKSLLNEKARELGVSMTDKAIYPQLCFKACQSILLEMVLTFGKPPYTAYALEYFVTAPSLFDLGENARTVNMDLDAYYNQLVIRLEETLTGTINSAILTHTDGVDNTVLNLDKIREDLKSIVHKFYTNNPALLESTKANTALQKAVNKLFSNLSQELNQKASHNSSFKTY